jgi:hypothetical protein
MSLPGILTLLNFIGSNVRKVMRQILFFEVFKFLSLDLLNAHFCLFLQAWDLLLEFSPVYPNVCEEKIDFLRHPFDYYADIS